MNKLAFLIYLAPLAPLLAAFLNIYVIAVVSFLACAGMTGFLLVSERDIWGILYFTQVPTVMLMGLIAIHFSRKFMSEQSQDVAPEMETLNILKERHTFLKKSVLKSEKEETQAMQIYGLTKGLAEALSWTDMAPRLTSGIQKIFGAYEFILYAVSREGEWTLLHRRGSWASDVPVEGSLSWEGRIVHPPQAREVVPVQVVPIFSDAGEERIINGVLYLKSVRESVSEKELLDIGQEFGEQIGMALNKALLFAQMEMHSRTDGLTGLLRRQYFMDRLQDELKRATAFQTPFCVLMVDIDHFKRVNDQHGHAAGDAVLSRIGQVLKESFYETDVAGRYGGEEFIVLLPHAQLDGVKRKAENLRARIEREKIASGFVTLSVTVSIGIADFPSKGRTASEIIGQADRALYAAKESGRNRVIVA